MVASISTQVFARTIITFHILCIFWCLSCVCGYCPEITYLWMKLKSLQQLKWTAPNGKRLIFRQTPLSNNAIISLSMSILMLFIFSSFLLPFAVSILHFSRNCTNIWLLNDEPNRQKKKKKKWRMKDYERDWRDCIKMHLK